MAGTNGRGGRYALAATAVALSCSLFAGLAAGQNKPAPKPKTPPAPKYATDADVVASMKKGIDYLLSAKNAQGNWETGRSWPKSGQKAGETSLVLYALMHAAHSLQDDLVYQQKLSWRNKETVGPAVDWLIQQTPEETYTAGMMASALTLLPKRKDEKPGEGVRGALERCRDYLMVGMGGDGGYTYSAPGGGDGARFQELWDKYVEALIAASRPGGNAKDEAEEVKKKREDLDKAVRSLRNSFGGADMAMQSVLANLRAKQTAAEAAKNAGEANRARAEIVELNKYWQNAPKTGGRNLAEELKKAREELARVSAQRVGVAFYEREVKDKDGKTVMRGNDKVMEKVPKTQADIDREIQQARAKLQSAEIQAKNDFSPIGDLSNAQYGALGAWALADWGMEIRTDYWEVTDRFWRLLQKQDGAWTYASTPGPSGNTTHTMGVAGIATLFVTTEFTDDKPPTLTPRTDPNIERGLAWLDKDFSAKGRGHFYYYMYGVERVGLSTGLKFFGTTDWYRDGSTAIIKQQKPDGSWDGEYNQNVSTSYALLFLSRGRNPIVFNKLQYEGPWNARPRDNAYITRWMAKEYEKPINWQIVNLKVDAEQWLDAPILLITGSVDPKFGPEDIAKLRTFINAGGLIFSTADGGAAAFTQAMQRYATEVVDRKYEMRPLPNNHVLFSNELVGSDIKAPPQMLGMSNGLREIWVHSTVDMGASWQARRYSQKDHFLIPAALFFYATGKGSLRGKLAPLAVDLTTAPEPVRTIGVARVDHQGNADPEPGAWARFAKLAEAEFKTKMPLSTVKFTELDAKKTPVAHITGTTGFTANEAEIAAAQKFIKDGGMFFIDAAGGSGQFGSSALSFIRSVYPSNALEPLPEDHPIINGKMPDGVDCSVVRWRNFARLKVRGVNTAQFEGVKDGNRWTVIYSAHDVTSGLLGTNTWGIVGYNADWAENLARNVVLFAHLQNNPPAASQPAATTAPATQAKTAAK